MRIVGIGGRFGVGVVVFIGLELFLEFLCVVRGEGGVVFLVLLRWVMVFVKDNLGNGFVREIVVVFGFGGVVFVGLRFGIERGVVVVLDKLVMYLVVYGDV